MAWNNAVVTNAGIALYSEALSEQGVIITKALGGSDNCKVGTLTQQINVTSPALKLSIISIVSTDSSKEVTVRIVNTELENPLLLKQIGLYAKNAAEGEEILFALIQDDIGVLIPSHSDNPLFNLEFGFILPFSNTSDVRAEVNFSVFATLEDVDKTFKANITPITYADIDSIDDVEIELPEFEGEISYDEIDDILNS